MTFFRSSCRATHPDDCKCSLGEALLRQVLEGDSVSEAVDEVLSPVERSRQQQYKKALGALKKAEDELDKYGVLLKKAKDPELTETDFQNNVYDPVQNALYELEKEFW